MIDYILGILIAATLVFAVVKQIKRKKADGGCAGCTICRRTNNVQENNSFGFTDNNSSKE